MRIKISYLCPKCNADGSVEIEFGEVKKDFKCEKCGFENSITMKSPHEVDVAKAEAFVSSYVSPRNFSPQSAERDVWTGVRTGYLQGLEDFRTHMRECLKELNEARLRDPESP